MSLDVTLAELTAVLAKYLVYAGGKESPVIVVFGASGETGRRGRCIARLREIWPAAVLIRPEDCWNPNEKALDLAEFEAILSEISDCTIIFPESPGSYAETGYFSAKKPLRVKLLVASPLKYQTAESFLTRGPFQAIDRDSIFKNCLWIGDGFSEIEARLQRLPKTSARLRQLSEPNLDYRDIFYLCWLVVWLCQAIRDVDALELLLMLAGNRYGKMIKRCLKILTAVGLIKLDGLYHVAHEIKGLPHPESRVDLSRWRAKVTAAISQHDPGVMQYLGQSSAPKDKTSSQVRA